MKKVLFVLGEYVENTAQNGICIREISKHLEKRNIECHVLCMEYNKSINIEEWQENEYIVWSNKQKGRLQNRCRQIIKALHMPVGSIRLSRKVARTIEILDDKNHYACIIAVVNPTESAEAVFRYKRKGRKTNCIIYEIDPTSNRYKTPTGILQKIWVKASQRWETKIYNSFDKVVHMRTHFNHFSSPFYSKFDDKTIYLDIPSFQIADYFSENVLLNNKKTISMVYAGAFYPVLREPDYMISVLKMLSQKYDIQLDIFTGYNMRQHIEKIIGTTNNFRVYDLISQNNLDRLIEKRDILLSIGNSNSDFLPSKVLYYIGTGKPVIHFCPDKTDVAVTYLEKYPYALIINQSKSIEKNISEISSFLHILNKKKISKTMLLNIFKKNTAKYTAEEFIGLIDDE